MYQEVLVPNAQNNKITIPRKWYGRKVRVSISPVEEKWHSLVIETEEEEPEIDYTDMKQVLANTDPEALERINKIFDKYLIPMNDFKFDRDEANNYD